MDAKEFRRQQKNKPVYVTEIDEEAFNRVQTAIYNVIIWVVMPIIIGVFGLGCIVLLMICLN